jgi:cytochrome c1
MGANSHNRAQLAGARASQHGRDEHGAKLSAIRTFTFAKYFSDSSGPLAPTVTLKGADLYRLKCQACHGTMGEGAPPEINSIINPVRATSATLILARMKQNGAAMSRKDAMALAIQSETALLDRLRKGGTNMPNPSLREAEIRVLMPYLKQLAGLPAKQIGIQEPAVRVGEHLCGNSAA